MKRTALLALPLVILAFGCHKEEPVEQLPTPVTVLEVKSTSGSASESTRYSATVTPQTQVEVSFKQGGYVETILSVPGKDGQLRLVQSGDIVSVGAPLAQIRQGDYIARVDQARAQQSQATATIAQAGGGLAQAQATTEQAMAGVKEAEAGLHAAKTQVEEAVSGQQQAKQQLEAAHIGVQQASHQQTEARAGLEQTQGGVDEASAGFNKANEDYKRASALYASHSLTRTDYDAAKAAYEVYQAKKQQIVSLVQQARAKVSQASEQIKAAQNKVDQAKVAVSVAGNKIQEARSQVAARASQVTQAKARVAAAQSAVRSASAQISAAQAAQQGATAQLSAAQIPLTDTMLKSPIAGVVLARRVEVGTLVAPGTPAFSIADVSKVKVMFGVPDTEIKRLHMGQDIPVEVAVLGTNKRMGRITSLAPSADPKSRLFSVEVTLANPKRDLKVGMIASLALSGKGASTGGAIIPMSALLRSKTQAYGYCVVVVDKGNTAKLRDVGLGTVYGNRIAVTGIQAGESIVATGGALLHDGETVRVVGKVEGSEDGSQN